MEKQKIKKRKLCLTCLNEGYITINGIVRFCPSCLKQRGEEQFSDSNQNGIQK